MAFSRYTNTSVLENHYYATSDEKDFSKIVCYNIRATEEDRLDTLAHKYLGNSEYWWVIAMINDIDWFFNFTPGDILKVPVDINEFLRLM